jgi:DNA-binding PadR family transcriptional regulator
MKIYVLEEVCRIGGSFSIETIGVYSSQELIEKAISTLPEETKDYVYNIEIFHLNDPPKGFIITEEEIMEEIKKMMDMGLVDQLVGEDGNFYYSLTEAGKQMGETIIDEHVKDEDQDGQFLF